MAMNAVKREDKVVGLEYLTKRNQILIEISELSIQNGINVEMHQENIV